METLRCCSHQAFPVTPDVKKAFDSAEPFELHGTILRHTVLHLLQHRIGFFDPLQADIPPSRSHIPSTQTVSSPSAIKICRSVIKSLNSEGMWKMWWLSRQDAALTSHLWAQGWGWL